MDSDEDYHYSDDEEDELQDAAADGAAQSSLAAASQQAHGLDQPCASLGQREYRVLEGAQLVGERDALISEVQGLLDLEAPVAAALLRQYKWSRERLLDAYMADSAAALAAAGMTHLGEAAPAPEAPVTCQVCVCETPPAETFGLGCGHLFCDGCWGGYLLNQVLEGPACVFAPCPMHGCGEVVAENHFARFLRAEQAEAYDRYLLRSFVDSNRTMRWCPAADCGRAVQSSGAAGAVKCACGKEFCFRCGEEAHPPISCALLRQWGEKCSDESETANWILANTKRCPKCHVRIEKNQGCNHMTCRQASCTHEFCWICMGPWAEHGATTGGFYKCNRFEAAEKARAASASVAGAQAGMSAAQRAEAELNRYLHYFKRFANHQQAGQFAERQLQQAEQRMIDLQSQMGNISWIDVQFLRQAVEILIRCRYVLKYSYAMGFYLEDGREKELFEYLQENLEKNTEHLADLTEQPLESVQREEVTNYARVTEQFLQNLLQGIEDGLTTSS